jgi:hypothetical protein
VYSRMLYSALSIISACHTRSASFIRAKQTAWPPDSGGGAVRVIIALSTGSAVPDRARIKHDQASSTSFRPQQRVHESLEANQCGTDNNLHYLLGHNTVQYAESPLKFQRNMSPPSSGFKKNPRRNQSDRRFLACYFLDHEVGERHVLHNDRCEILISR